MSFRLRSREAEPMHHDATGVLAALGGVVVLVLLVAFVAVVRDGV